MNKHFGVSWGIAVIAILGVLVWQALSIVELYHFQNERFITKVNHKMCIRDSSSIGSIIIG